MATAEEDPYMKDFIYIANKSESEEKNVNELSSILDDGAYEARYAHVSVQDSVIWPVLTGGQKPEFDRSPVNVTAIKGQPVVLPCTVLNKNDNMLVWMNPRRIYLSSDDRRVIDDPCMSIERPFVRDWNNYIRNVQVHDDGEYTCQINTDPIQIKRIRLKVQVPAEIDNVTSSGDVTVHEGQTVKLQCVATGKPPPSINWYRNTLQTNQIKEQYIEPTPPPSQPPQNVGQYDYIYPPDNRGFNNEKIQPSKGNQQQSGKCTCSDVQRGSRAAESGPQLCGLGTSEKEEADDSVITRAVTLLVFRALFPS